MARMKDKDKTLRIYLSISQEFTQSILRIRFLSLYVPMHALIILEELAFLNVKVFQNMI